ncbi:MAG: non-canonical purine pyrophosphatase [Bacteroidetes bacterium]|nr:non-canonical purine pyrophosphatase [Bacteroidota bacterium]
MKKQFVFATNNLHKLQEVRTILGNDFDVLSLQDIHCLVDIPETGATLQENALIKALYVKNNYGYACFADDTGLEVEALDNAPGVYSARYAGDDHNSERNVDKLLKELLDKKNRKARFRTVIAFLHDNQEFIFEGQVNGTIATERKGNSGFGYDPVFVPEGYHETFAEMGENEKNKISHRALAVQRFSIFLKSLRVG